MATITRFEDLEIWQLARNLASEVFHAYTHCEPFLKDYKLREQINGSSGSIMDNIAEGFERNSRNEFVNFLSIAKASSGEVKSQLYRAFDRHYITKEHFDKLHNQTDNIGRQIGGFINYLNSSLYKGSKFKNRTTDRPNSKS